MINGIINDKLENIEENKLFPFENAFNYNKNYKCKSYMKRQIWKKHKLYNKVGLSCHFFKIQYVCVVFNIWTLNPLPFSASKCFTAKFYIKKFKLDLQS